MRGGVWEWGVLDSGSWGGDSSGGGSVSGSGSLLGRWERGGGPHAAVDGGTGEECLPSPREGEGKGAMGRRALTRARKLQDTMHQRMALPQVVMEILTTPFGRRLPLL